MKHLAFALVVIAAACGGKKDDKPADKSAETDKPKPESKPIEAQPAEAKAAEPKPAEPKPTPPADEAIPDTPELQRAAELTLKASISTHKAKPAPGLPGVKMIGGCTQTKVDNGISLACYGMPVLEAGYIERKLLLDDGWKMDSQKRGPKGAYWIEASKGASKIFVEVSQDQNVGMSAITNVLIMKR